METTTQATDTTQAPETVTPQISTSRQILLSALVGGVAQSAYLISSYFLDKRIGFQWANIIGMGLAYTIDFFAQQYIFLGKIGDHSRFVIRFLIHISLEIVVAQLLFKLVLTYLKKHQHHFYQHKLKGIWITVIRQLIQIFIFFTITFPMRKYFVFV